MALPLGRGKIRQEVPVNETLDLYWFSGTGNTLLVARAMADEFAAHGWDVHLWPMTEVDPNRIAPQGWVGLAFPVAVQTTYPLVWEFCERLALAEGMPVFMVDTLAGYSGAIVGPLREVVRRRGYTPVGAREIRMPSNLYPIATSEERNRRLRERALAQARRYARDLMAGRARWGHIPLLPDLFRALTGARWMWRWVAWTDTLLAVDAEACTRCGLCAELCPVGNIALEPLPRYLGKCQQCMRCLSYCPTGALKLGSLPRRPYRAVPASDLV
jgi:NAD-dependent dihydropyrimidine dehydrogenase PreA subunit